jgi:gamma-glutamyltranspeptidase/glutathione hydrolase
MQPLKRQNAQDGVPDKIPIQDTTTCVVADRWGNFVAATPSCNLVGNKPGPSGVTQGNRLRSLNTTPGHPNRIQPGKRPRITLTPTLVTKAGQPILAISVAGGDLQDQTTLNVLLNHIEFGMLPAEAVVAPRFSTGHHQDSFNPIPDRDKAVIGLGQLTLGNGISPQVVEGLQQRGHKLTQHERNAYTKSGAIGHPIMIYREPESGLFHVAGDPQAGRHAAALK